MCIWGTSMSACASCPGWVMDMAVQNTGSCQHLKWKGVTKMYSSKEIFTSLGSCRHFVRNCFQYSCAFAVCYIVFKKDAIEVINLFKYGLETLPHHWSAAISQGSSLPSRLFWKNHPNRNTRNVLAVQKRFGEMLLFFSLSPQPSAELVVLVKVVFLVPVSLWFCWEHAVTPGTYFFIPLIK